MALRRLLTRALSLTLGALLLCAAAVRAQDVQPVPALTARVMDPSATLDPARRRQLEDKLAAFEAERGAQLVVLLVPTTRPEDISAYANRVFNTWKPGRAGIGDGLLIVAAMQDRKIRIEVARALEGAIPDLAAKQVIDEALTPHFRQGDYAGGLDQATDRLMALIRGEALPAPTPRRTTDETDWTNLAVLLFIVVPVVGSIMRRILGHKLGTVVTGGLIGFAAFWFTASLLLATIAALLGMLLTFIAGTPLGAALLAASQRSRQGGFGSGGGFSSGGGGDGAGGGASGDW